MRNPLGFFAELLQQPRWVVLWVLFLMLLNGGAAAFRTAPVARLIFLTFMLSAMLMMALYARFGFSKLLGLGHVLWIPLAPWVGWQAQTATGALRIYLMVWCMATAVSLVFDVNDVRKHFKARGSRKASGLS